MSYEGVAGCEVMRVNDALATIEQMALGGEYASFDMVFVDADKTRLLEYVEALVSNDNILAKGGLIVVDNVLWKGLVLETAQGEQQEEEYDHDDDDEPARKGRRARKLASKMHHFNSHVVKDDRLEVVVLPVRDGLSVIRKR